MLHTNKTYFIEFKGETGGLQVELFRSEVKLFRSEFYWDTQSAQTTRLILDGFSLLLVEAFQRYPGTCGGLFTRAAAGSSHLLVERFSHFLGEGFTRLLPMEGSSHLIEFFSYLIWISNVVLLWMARQPPFCGTLSFGSSRFGLSVSFCYTLLKIFPRRQ